MTDTTLAELKRLLAEATDGPWEVSRGCDQYVCNGEVWIAATMGTRAETGAANMALIVAMYRALPALIACAEVMERFVEHARVGSGNKPVTRSARVNCSAGIYHDARAALSTLETDNGR